MKHKIDIEFRAYCSEYDIHSSYRLKDFERTNPEILLEIIKTIEAQMSNYAELKDRHKGASYDHLK